MPLRTALTAKLEITHPILLAPMDVVGRRTGWGLR